MGKKRKERSSGQANNAFPPAHALGGMLFIAAIAVGFIMSLFNPGIGLLEKDIDVATRLAQERERERGVWETILHVSRGEWSDLVEQRYESSLPLRDFAVHCWTAFRYAFFREGRPGVIIGTEEWLFTAQEFHVSEEEEETLATSLEAILETREFLRERNIDLIVALVPSKSRVYHHKLGGYALPSAVAERYSLLLRMLHAYEVNAPDLYAAMVAARGDGQVFLRTDTHWTPFGAERAAASIADAAFPLLKNRNIERLEFKTVRSAPVEHRGDLLPFIPLGRFERLMGPRPDIFSQAKTSRVYGDPEEAGLFGEITIPVTLVGTSFSAGEAWNFDGFLKERLEADVLTLAQEGRGPFLPMREYLESDTFWELSPHLVIWEIPERYLILPHRVIDELSAD